MDLVVDEPVNQIVKCPITRMPIKELAKNKKCDHVYERSAILAYMKSRPNRKYIFFSHIILVLLNEASKNKSYNLKIYLILRFSNS